MAEDGAAIQVSEVLQRNLERVRERIAAACGRAGRPAEDVRLVAVTKYVQPAVIRTLLELGVTDVGESRVQQLVPRAAELGADPGRGLAAAPTTEANAPCWHMVGHLQRNKVKQLLPHARIVHSVDSVRLAEELDQVAARPEAAVDIFLELNVSGEASKYGIAPTDLPPLLERVRKLPRLRVCGLMTMAPLEKDPEAARPYFGALRDLLEQVRAQGIVDAGCRHLSMGMTQDYEIAVEEGATLVRVGSALFEGLPEAAFMHAG